jgi:hypothetical protein
MARNKKAKEYASLAAHVEPPAESAPGQPEVPALEPWEEGTLKLQQLVARIESDFLDFLDVAQRAMKEQWHLKYGYVDAADYFENVVHMSYRTVRRRLAVLEAIQRLPEAEQAEAKAAMTALGSKKAGALAPLLGKPDLDWKAAATFAKGVNEAAVQSMVSEKLGHQHRGLTASQHPGERFLAYLLNVVPPDERERTEFVFQQLMKMAESRNAMAIFLVLVGLGEQELAAHGIVQE